MSKLGARSWDAPEPSATASDSDPQASDLPLDAHLHTDQSPDSEVPIDAYAAEAVARRIPEIAITDHVDFDPRDPAYRYTAFADRERIVRVAAERWAAKGLTIRFGVELTYHTAWDEAARDHLRRYRYDYVIGSVHEWPDSPYVPSRVAGWVTGRPLDEVVGPYYEQVVAAARSGLFDTIGHLDVVKRYLFPHVTPAELARRPELVEPSLRAIVDAGAALEVNSSGLRHLVREPYPGGATVARFRELGGERVVAGSDAHRSDWFAWRLDEAYRLIEAAGFDELAFRRGDERARIALPVRRAA
ncbi:MAG TPA: histidinol-phosphatase HisJ family protein [Candidatus Limnocylindrales bacterium]|nr:histidinol-phosphatase HisJ family protein [Candidatus Limnocylindrales bacterium]